jgi:RNA polymerase sigma factor (sigma-70 family)
MSEPFKAALSTNVEEQGEMARPLTRVQKKTEKIYVRPKAIEAEIDRALKDGFSDAIRRARVRDEASPDYVHPECLVHLIRETKRAGKDRESEAFLQSLLARCEANLRGTIRDDGIPNPEQLRDDILQHLAMKFAQDAVEGGGRLDYFECRFNSAFRTLRIDFYNREAALVNRSAVESKEPGEDLIDDVDGNHAPDTGFWRSSRMEDRIFAKQVAAFLGQLPADERKAVIMCRVWNLTQEDAARRLGVSVRTIYNCLTRADLKLASIKEDVR